MKILACLLMLCGYAASPASGRDWADALRERLNFCSQFIIEDPGPVMGRDSALDYGLSSSRIYDCPPVNQDDKYT
jgi:hypothetical protein